MLTGLYSAATAMDSAQLQHEVIATNLANVDVAGYRRRTMMHKTFESSLDEARGHNSLGTVTDVAVDFEGGVMDRTGRPLDLAIQGDGFFVVEFQAQEFLTRNGGFHLNEQGQLVTTGGMAVMGENGPLNFPPETSPSNVVVNQQGEVFVNEARVGRLRLLDVNDPKQLEIVGTTFFKVPDEMGSQQAEGQVVQGVQEKSNVHPMQELVLMIATSRQHEAAQKAMNALTESLKRHTDL